MHNEIYSGRKHIYFIHAFIMFILIHKNSLKRLNTQEYLSGKEVGPQLATSLQRSTQP